MPRRLERFYPLLLVLPVLLLLGVLLQVRPGVTDFRQHPAGPERKQVFLDYFLPLVQEANARILTQREYLLRLRAEKSLDWWQRDWLRELADEYGLESFDPGNPEHWKTLRRRVDIVPASLTLAQAAKESGWGTSRFAVEGRNFFGHWCYEQGCGLVPGSRAEGAVHEVAVFPSPQSSVERYLHNLNTHDAYRDLRLIRERLRASSRPLTGPALADGLQRYSERGGIYVEEVKSMIRHNDLDRYDES